MGLCRRDDGPKLKTGCPWELPEDRQACGQWGLPFAASFCPQPWQTPPVGNLCLHRLCGPGGPGPRPTGADLPTSHQGPAHSTQHALVDLAGRGGGQREAASSPPSPTHLPERTRLRREAVGTGNTEDKPRPPATPLPRLTRGRRFTHIRDQCQEAWARRRPPGVLFAWLWVTNVTGGLRGWFGHRPKGAEGRDMGPGMLPGIS